MKNKYVLVILILISMTTLSFNVCSEDGNSPVSGSCAASGEGNTCHWEYDSSTNTLTISGKGKMDDFQRSLEEYTTAPWYAYHNQISNVIVEDGITNVSQNAFALLTELKNVSLSPSVSEIGLGGFYYCQNLKNINLPENLQNIGVVAFTYSGLKSVDLPDNVLQVGTYAFATSSLENITFSASTQLGKSVFWELGFAHPQNKLRVYCKGDVKTCTEQIKNTNSVYPFKTDVKIYRSDHRIYTIDEANQDAGKINRISIKYR